MAAAAPVPFVLIVDNTVVAADAVLTEDDVITQSLIWIGFTQAAQRNLIKTKAFNCIRDVKVLSEEDINSLSHSFSSRSAADGRILFGLKRTKYLKGFAHFIQDFFRVNDSPVINGLCKDSFCNALDVAL